jgi:hypothetical protein
MFENKTLMSSTWANLGHLGTYKDEIKWLGTFGWQNLETLKMCHQTLSSKLICGSLVYSCVVDTHLNDVKVLLFWKWTIKSWYA